MPAQRRRPAGIRPPPPSQNLIPIAAPTRPLIEVSLELSIKRSAVRVIGMTISYVASHPTLVVESQIHNARIISIACQTGTGTGIIDIQCVVAVSY